MATIPQTHIAVFAFPFASHHICILNLARRLASATPSVFCSFFSTAKSNKVLFHDHELVCHNIRPYDISDGKPGYDSMWHPEEDVKLFMAVAKEELRRGVKVAEADIGMKITCLVSDSLLWFTGDLAQEMNKPWVALYTAGSCSLSSHVHTDLIRQKVSANFKSTAAAGCDDEIVDLVPGLSKVRLGDLPMGIISGDLELPSATMLYEMSQTISRATVVIINSFEELDPPLTKDLSLKFKNFLNIGPLNLISKSHGPQSKVDGFSCISWLESKKPRSVAYISFGTICRLPNHELVALAQALDETKTPFLWSITDDCKKNLPKGFLERTTGENGTGKVVAWAPQIQVLEHFAIGVHITHGGWNSVLESIGAGVPLICRPFWADNHIDAWMVEKIWGIGVRIHGDSFTKYGTCFALEQVLMLDGPSKRFKDRVEALKDLAHKAVDPKGSSSQNFKTLVNVITGAVLPKYE